MEIKKKINVPREFIFDKIIDSCLYDIEKQTGKRPKLADLNGFSYVKTFGKNQRGTIKFDEVSGPSVYSFVTSTTKTVYNTRWELQEEEKGSTIVVIKEHQSGSGFFRWLNDMVVGFLLGRLKKRQMIAMIEAIEKSYVGG